MGKYHETRVIALDVYGTMLPTIGDNVKRKGVDGILTRCKNDGLILCTCSDGNIKSVKRDLNEAGIDRYFDEFFEMARQRGDFTKQPKDIKRILKYYQERINLTPRELLVIGDRIERDIEPARELGCHTILVPEYYNENERYNFDMNSIRIP